MNKDILKIDNAKIKWRNFSGKTDQYNTEGKRSFCVVIEDPEMGRQMAEDGWNIKIKPPREEGEDPFMYLNVTVSYKYYSPTIVLSSGNSRVMLNKETVGRLDDIDIQRVDLDISPSYWKVNNNVGIKAYLNGMWVTQRLDRFAQRYSEERDMDEPEE